VNANKDEFIIEIEYVTLGKKDIYIRKIGARGLIIKFIDLFHGWL